MSTTLEYNDFRFNEQKTTINYLQNWGYSGEISLR